MREYAISEGESMKLVACVATVLFCMFLLADVASADSSSNLGGAGSTPVESPLVVPQAEILTGGSGLQEAQQVQLTSPVAVSEREASRTRYENLDAEQADEVAEAAFPLLVSQPAGGLTNLPSGTRATSYLTDDAAQIVSGEGSHGVVASTAPIAVETSPGQHAPLDLSLAQSRGGFEPKTPLVGVQIPQQLSGGIQLVDSGIGLTPVFSGGAALNGSEGSLHGPSVFFANVLTDSDILVKATTFGFETDTLLRSVESPEELSFRVDMPSGASLSQSDGDDGPVQVVKEGTTLAEIPVPTARDANGTAVPVSLGVLGDILTLTVSHRLGQYRYPIDVDPTVEDKDLADCRCWGSSGWGVYTLNEGIFETKGLSEGGVETTQAFYEVPYTAGDWIYWYYLTQGLSRVYAWTANSHEEDGPNVETRLYMASSKGLESAVVKPPATGAAETTQCVKEGCAAAPVKEEGVQKAKESGAFFQDVVVASGSSAWNDKLLKVTVDVNQEEGPTPEVEGGETVYYGKYSNALYGGR